MDHSLGCWQWWWFGTLRFLAMVCRSYRDNRRVIILGSVQCTVLKWILPSEGFKLTTAWSKVSSTNGSLQSWLTNYTWHKAAYIPLKRVCFSCSLTIHCTVNVVKFLTLHSILIMPIFLCVCVFFSQNTWWNCKQWRPWSDCSFRSSLIWVYTVCICILYEKLV